MSIARHVRERLEGRQPKSVCFIDGSISHGDNTWYELYYVIYGHFFFKPYNIMIDIHIYIYVWDDRVSNCNIIKSNVPPNL